MSTKIITIHIDDVPVEVTLKSAKKADGILRGELMTKAIGNNAEATPQSLAAFYLFPTCVAATKEPTEVREMSFDKFMNEVDEADIDLWVSTAYELNPHWRAGMKKLSEMTTDEEKKTGQLLNGSNTLTEVQS